ncbi:MAG: hypothetical protein ACPG4Q_01490 [Phycisphaeraceae bacterium]
MINLSRLLILLLMVSALTCWAEPAAAARLANVSGQAGDQEQREDASFKLGSHSQVQIQYKINALDKGCNVLVRVHRKQDNGDWLLVTTSLRTNKSTSGTRDLTLSAGDYKIEVISKHAKYDISVDM